MQSGDDALERLRSAIEQLAAFDVDGLVAEARAEARARVRAKLVGLMEESMLEQIEQDLASPLRAPDWRPAEQRARDRRPAEPPPPKRRPANPPPPDSRRADHSPPEPEPETGPAWYVYGVVDAEIEPEAPVLGVDPSSPVELLAEGSLAAAVSKVALEEFGETQLREHLRDMAWVERIARAHETVLDRLQGQATVVPMRMCTVYRTESRVREMLEREQAALRQALDHLDGKSEWGLKAFADAGQMTGVAADHAEGDAAYEEGTADSEQEEARGASYMRRRLGERDRRQRARQQLEDSASQIHERLVTLAFDAQVMPPQRPEVSGHSGDMVLNGAYLVARDEQERFHAEVRVLEAEFAPLGLELELTGPWPAYNFVPGTIGAGW